MNMSRDWGKVFVATRYQPQVSTWTAEALIGLVQFGLRNAGDQLVEYVKSLESLVDTNGMRPSIPRPDRYLRQGDRRDITYSKTMHKAANTLVRVFLKTECDSICFIDSDAVFGTDALEELRTDPEGWDYDVLQAFTVKRGWPPEPMYLTEMPEQPQGGDRLRGLHFETNLPLDGDRIYPVDAVSLHFTLIRRWIFERLLEPEGPQYTYWFEYSRDNGEDMTFSASARKVEARLGMTTRLKVGHVSDVVTGWDAMVDYYDRQYAVTAGEAPASLDHIRPYFEAQQQLAQLVAEFTGEDPELAYQRACSGVWAIHDQWRTRNPETVDEVHAFYGTTPQYLYGLVKWNSTPAYQRLLNGLKDVHGEKILEFGGGLGTTTEFLATRGNRVDYYDLPGILLDFARWRFQRLDPHFDRMTKAGDPPWRPIRIVEQWEIADEPGRGYDRIVAIDVLEHLHVDEFDFLCEGLLMGLRPGGIFYAHNNWEDPEHPHPSHFDHAAKWDAFVSRNGLVAVGDWAWRKPEVTHDQ
jgi:SAM-dependent methyltransferase